MTSATRTICTVGVMFAILAMVSGDAPAAPATPDAANGMSVEKLQKRFEELFQTFNATASELYSSLSEKAKVQIGEATKKVQESFDELKTKLNAEKKPAAA